MIKSVHQLAIEMAHAQGALSGLRHALDIVLASQNDGIGGDIARSLQVAIDAAARLSQRATDAWTVAAEKEVGRG